MAFPWRTSSHTNMGTTTAKQAPSEATDSTYITLSSERSPIQNWTNTHSHAFRLLQWQNEQFKCPIWPSGFSWDMILSLGGSISKSNEYKQSPPCTVLCLVQNAGLLECWVQKSHVQNIINGLGASIFNTNCFNLILFYSGYSKKGRWHERGNVSYIFIHTMLYYTNLQTH
jgi:hypothetical protein